MLRLILIAFFALTIFLQAQPKTTIAVIDLNEENIAAPDARIITSRLRIELFKTDKFVVIEREKMDEILEEQGFQLSGCTTNECAIEVGKLLGVEKMVAGEIGRIGNLYTISLRLIDVETGEILETATEDCECRIETVLTQSVSNVSQKLGGVLVLTPRPQIQKEPLYGNNLTPGNTPEWEIMQISRDKWIEFKRAGMSYQDWNKYMVIGTTVDDLLYLNSIGWVDSLNVSLSRRILEWDYMGIDREQWVEFKRAGLAVVDYEHYRNLHIKVSDLTQIKKAGMMDLLNSSLKNGISEWELMNIPVDKWIAFKKTNSSYDDWLVYNKKYAISVDDYIKMKNELLQNRSIMPENFNDLEIDILVLEWRNRIVRIIQTQDFFKDKWSNFKQKKGLKISLKDWTENLTMEEWIAFKKSNKNISKWLIEKLD